MAKISLTIEAADSTDLADTISSLMYLSAYKSDPAGEGREMTAAEAKMYAKDEEAHPEDYQPPKRTRRTKAQIEADNAPASRESSSKDSGNESAASAGASASIDPFAEQIRESAKEPAASDITNAQVRAAMTKYLSGGHTAKEASDILQRVGGVPNLGALDPSHYAAALAAFEAG